MIFEQDTWYKAGKKGKVRHNPYPRPKATKIPPHIIREMIADWDKRFALANPRHKQLKHIITKFGGILPFSLAVGVHPNTILWQWLGVSAKHTLKDKPRYGILSLAMLCRVLRFARHLGIVMTPEDLFPDVIEGGIVKNPLSHPEMQAWIHHIEPSANMIELESMLANMIEPR